MKTFLLSILLIYSTLQAHTNIVQQSVNQFDYLKSHSMKFKNNNGKSNYNIVSPDSIILSCSESNCDLGYSASSAGDVNGDGYSDVIVGGGFSDTGKAYIFYGGFFMDNNADVILKGEQIDDYFGRSVSCAGDVNGDGFSDVIVGAFGYDSFTGRVYIYFGGIAMDNIPDIIIYGHYSGEFFGYSATSAGDVNGDGFSDVIIGEYPIWASDGRAFVYYGDIVMDNIADVILDEDSSFVYGPIVSSAGDVNGDGFSDVVVGSSFNNNIVFSNRAYIYLGGSTMDNIADLTIIDIPINQEQITPVPAFGDLNGDGYSDLLIGLNYYETMGKVKVYFGSSSLDSIADLIITGSPGSKFGYPLSSAGDVNGDGFSDIVIGEGINPKKAYIYYGGINMDNIKDFTINGGNSISSAGDINGDNFSDVIVGNGNYATIYFNFRKIELVNPYNSSNNNPLVINFNWLKFQAAVNYKLLISTDSIFSNVIFSDTLLTDTTITINGFKKGEKYYWMVKTIDSLGYNINSSIWNFKTVPPIKANLKVLMEGMYSPTFNQLSRNDTIQIYLRTTTAPFELIDSTEGIIDSTLFSNNFNFYNTPSGVYYFVVKHFNSIETWSKTGGEILNADGSIYNFDFTNSLTQAYGNNLKLKGSNYCLFSGDANQDGFVNLSDLIQINNDASAFLSGRYIVTDLTGDNIVDLTDVSLCYNNASNFISFIQP